MATNAKRETSHSALPSAALSAMPDAASPADDVVAQLSLLEKAALLSGANIWQTRAIPRLNIPSIFLADGPHGVRKQLGASDHLGLNASEPSTCFPTSATVANSWDVELAEAVGTALGSEAENLGVNVLLGPGLNIKRSPLGGRNFEYFSEDPYLSGKLAAGYVRGIQTRNVLACPKHFAVNNQETRRMSNDSIVDERTIREIYLTAFEIVVRESDPGAMMSSYNLVNGIYANENRHLLIDILRDDWGFDGLVVTDWGGGNDSIEGARNGSTLEMPYPGFDAVRILVEAVESGKLDESDIDARVRELLAALAKVADAKVGLKIDLDAHHDLARRAAEESAVLLKNDGVLPISSDKTVALIGDFASKPRYQGAGSSVVNPHQLETTLDAIAKSGLTMASFAQGYKRSEPSDAELVREAVAAACTADIVLLYLGLDEISEAEGIDRTKLQLPAAQVELLAELARANENIVVVLSAGSVIEMPWIENCKAIVHGYLAGQAGASALLNVLSGAVNPSGKLAETYPFAVEDNPTRNYFPGQQRTSEYREGPFIGYRYYDTADVPVRFPFGFGLSYTTFEYSELKVDLASGVVGEVTFTVTNTGELDGAEITQLYVGGGTGIPRPSKELKGFAKVHLAAGESRTVTIALDDKAFRYFDVASNEWQVESGEYSVMIGASVADIRLTQSVDVAGTVRHPMVLDALPHYFAGDITSVPDAEFAALLGREIPSSKWQGELGVNDALCQMYYARSPLARFAYRMIARQKNRAEAKGKPDLNVLFIFNMPFRAIAKMANGAVSMEMAHSIVRLVNGHFFRGMGSLIGGFFGNRRRNKATAREFAQRSQLN